MKPIKKILIIRFRQIGDSILAIPLCSTLKKSFPDAEIHFVLNKNIAPLYEGHPDIDKVITFDKDENKPFTSYIKKVWQVMHQDKYDAIIDMRSTIRTLFFSLFSLKTPFRIGRIKGYTRFLLNYRTDTYSKELTTDMVQRNLLLAAPLEKISPIQYTKEFKLYLTAQEKEDFRCYMKKEGIDFAHPVFLIGVTTKLIHKKWDTGFMIATLQKILEEHKDIQMIFNYAPGYEEEDARNIYKELGCPERIKINIQASSLRQLVALCANCSFYFGNEGGARHIAQSLGIPSFSIYSPSASKSMWLPANSVLAKGISPDDILPLEQQVTLTHEERFALITPEKVYEQLTSTLRQLG
ncbi:glycosyltransferase family 9 protein [Bacteroides sp. GM023]|uniref:glycosyltransferase family 9 protein n=1 Tax=Bacteroides sp. GM023 TaxID=2723058 RepID=UPI00168B42EB|nr:glycosyltransferase family 9 protein [Bacteroides sp. GM023]MBD3588951.1 glycosyltransferase family 9 protein [Bacteroides sp. GM023]